ncbi:MAG: hypothetical protein KTR31_20660 [Myxococcales bacterium]|nr:hypothetical protein [Myxococcales bacterium]
MILCAALVSWVSPAVADQPASSFVRMPTEFPDHPALPDLDLSPNEALNTVMEVYRKVAMAGPDGIVPTAIEEDLCFCRASTFAKTLITSEVRGVEVIGHVAIRLDNLEGVDPGWDFHVAPVIRQGGVGGSVHVADPLGGYMPIEYWAHLHGGGSGNASQIRLQVISRENPVSVSATPDDDRPNLYADTISEAKTRLKTLQNTGPQFEEDIHLDMEKVLNAQADAAAGRPIRGASSSTADSGARANLRANHSDHLALMDEGAFSARFTACTEGCGCVIF